MIRYLSIVLFCFLTAASSVYIDIVEHSISPITTLFYSFLLAVLFFNLINIHRAKQAISLSIANYKTIFKVNITTVFNWMFIFIPLKHIEPAFVIAIYMAVRPITTSLLTMKNKTRKQLFNEILFSVLIASCLILLVIDELNRTDNLWQHLYYVFMVFIAGISGSLSSIYAHRLSQKVFTASHVLSVRFILLTLVSFLLIFTTNVPLVVKFPELIQLVTVSVISVILPLYFLQKGLERIGPMQVAFMGPFIPVFTYIIEILYFKEAIRIPEFTLVCLLSIIVCLSVYCKNRRTT